jgi:hypothetical protein
MYDGSAKKCSIEGRYGSMQKTSYETRGRFQFVISVFGELSKPRTPIVLQLAPALKTSLT